MVEIGNDWDDILKNEFKEEYYLKLREFLKSEYKNHKIFPQMNDIFNALKITSYKDTRVVILGQDPYHNDGQAHGLAFSVKPGIKSPPSLNNIFKELSNELGCYIPNNGCLNSWAQQGVLLLNTALTVRAHEANSHSGKGWEILTDNIIKKLNDRDKSVIFILWGANARNKKKIIDSSRHFILEAPHPSPLSAHRGFFGCNHFAQTNEYLVKNGEKKIDWQIKNI
ncbi:uracil-DNA glycosylase [Peptostreptococcus faecalis]|uniref:uracil-DNA glycosylase n=1 Tax=Peptostreptococcus faecalis TaxID=2045015 RepID=UPI000C7C4FA4|nr:uracil-DNA glycosylase [Peptostreptococcus faecalis]